MSGIILTAVVATVFLVAAMVRRSHRDSSPERRARQAILDLGVDRNRRQVWGAASVGIIAAGSEFGGGSGGCGAGCGSGCGGGCGGCGG